jgi:hypothetical protein
MEIISSNFAEFCNLSLPLMPIQNFSATFQSLSKFWKFQSHNTKVMSRDKKVNITVTKMEFTKILKYRVEFAKVSQIFKKCDKEYFYFLSQNLPKS